MRPSYPLPPSRTRRLLAVVVATTLTGAALPALSSAAAAAEASPAGSAYRPVEPRRVMPGQDLDAGTPHTFVVGDAPEDAESVTLQLTGAETDARTDVAVCAGGSVTADCLAAPQLKLNAHEPGAVTVQVPLDDDARVTLQSTGDVRVYADVHGFTVAGAIEDAGSLYVPVSPVRVASDVDLGSHSLTTVSLPGLPESATAVAVTLTSSNADSPTYVSACPAGQGIWDCAATSVLNPLPERTRQASAVVKLGSGDAEIQLYNNSGATDVSVDLNGYYVDASATDAGGQLRTLDQPRRLESEVIAPGSTVDVRLPDVPDGATAAKLRLTGAFAWRPTTVSACPGPDADDACRSTAVLTVSPDIAARNTAVVMLGGEAGDTISLTSTDASVGVAIEILGFVVPVETTEPAPQAAPRPKPAPAPQPAPARKPAEDTTEPTPVPGVEVTDVERTEVTVTWEPATDDVAVAKYRVRRDGSYVDDVSPSTVSATVSDLTPGTEYRITIEAFDDAGNVSADRSVVVTTKQEQAPEPAPAPAPAPEPAPEPEPAPSTSSGKPGAHNTGVPKGTDLEVHHGDLVITRAGTVIDAMDIRGLVRVEAPDVTIKRSIIRGRKVTSDDALIMNGHGRYRFTLQDSELVAAHPSPYISGIIGANFTVKRTEIRGVIDQIHITGDDVTVESSWLHDNLHYDNDPHHHDGSHDDNIQVQGGDDIRIVGNTMTGSYNAALQVTQDRSDVSDLTFTNNWVNDGGCTVNIAEKRRGPMSGIKVAENVFGMDSRHRCGIISPTTTKLSAYDNYFTDGSRVRIFPAH